jgi:hypothetical protein
MQNAPAADRSGGFLVNEERKEKREEKWCFQIGGLKTLPSPGKQEAVILREASRSD